VQAFVIDAGARSALSISDSSRIARGGAGTVYRIESGPYAGSVAKILHDKQTFVREKIEAMIALTPSSSWMSIYGKKVPQFAWPTHVLENAQGEGIGFLMPQVDTSMAVSMSEYVELINTLPLADRSITLRVTVARNLAAALVEIHKKRHYFIDLKPQNIYVFKETGNVCLLDCDGYAIDGGKFPAGQYSSQYLSPEILINRVDPRALSLNDFQDRFAFATLAFQLLNYGVHPFQGIPKDQCIEEANTDEFVKRGWYPYGLSPNPCILPARYSIHEYWDLKSRSLFDKAFEAPRPSARPSAAEWTAHFDELIKQKAFSPCTSYPRDIIHIHFKGKDCFACGVLLRSQGAAPTAQRPVAAPILTAQPQARKPLSAWLRWAAIIFGLIAICVFRLLQ